MQKAFVLLLALIAVIYAQQNPEDSGPGGCCFFKEKNFVGKPIACTSEPFTIAEVYANDEDVKNRNKKSEGIQSFYCTERFSAAILDKDVLQELVDCGDVVNETRIPIPTESVTVGECLQRRCCFYTGKAKDGNEYCVNTDSAPADELPRVQETGAFLVAECLENWEVVGQTKKGKSVSVGCGETVDLEEGLTFTNIVTKPCGNARAVYEEVADDFGVYDAQLDQAVADTDAADEGFHADDFAVDAATLDYDESADQAVVESEEAYVDAAVSDSEEAYVDAAVADQAFYDAAAADAAAADQYLDQAFADAAVSDSEEAYVDTAVSDSEEAFVDAAVADASVEQVVIDEANVELVEGNVADAAVSDSEEAYVDTAVSDSEEAFVDAAVTDEFVDQAAADAAFLNDLQSDAALAEQFEQATMDLDDASFYQDQAVDQAVADASVQDQAFVDESFSDFDAADNFDQNY